MRSRGSAAAAVAALVLLVVPLGLVPHVVAPLPADTLGSGAVPRPAPGDPTAAAAMSCDAPAAPAADVPIDAIAARMCATGEGVVEWYAPQDSLHHDLAPLALLLDSLEPAPRSTDTETYFCTDDGGYGFDLRVARASGEVVSIPGDTGGCSTVRIGGEDLLGSDEVLATFLDDLAAQRRTSDPPAGLEQLALGCRNAEPAEDHRLSLIGDPEHLVRAVTCWRPNADGVPRWRGRRPVPRTTLTALVEDLTSRSRMQAQFGEPDCPGGPQGYYSQDIVGQTGWGDVVVARGVCREFLAAPAAPWNAESEGEPEHRFWKPSPDAQRMLDDLRHRPPLPS